MQIKGPDTTAVHGKRAWGLDASFSVLPNATVGRHWSFLSACFHTVLLAFHWHCPQFRIVCGTRFMYLSCVCLSVCLSQLSIAAAACGGFAAVGPAGGRYRSIAARPALSSSRAAERRSSGVRRPNAISDTDTLSAGVLQGSGGSKDLGTTPRPMTPITDSRKLNTDLVI